MNLAGLTVETVRERLRETGLSHAESLSKARQFARAAEALVQMGADGSAGAYAHFVPGRIEVLGKHTDYAGGRSIVSAVERGFCMIAVPRADGRARVLAVEQDESVECELKADLQVPQSGWTNYPLSSYGHASTCAQLWSATGCRYRLFERPPSRRWNE